MDKKLLLDALRIIEQAAEPLKTWDVNATREQIKHDADLVRLQNEIDTLNAINAAFMRR